MWIALPPASPHSISVAEEICHRIGIIQKGRLIACGTMEKLHEQSAGRHSNLESVFLDLTREQERDGVAELGV